MTEKNQKSCPMKEKITGYIDSELSDKDRDSVVVHLETCAVCRKEYDALTSLDSLLHASAPVEPSRDFSRNFWAKVDAAGQKKARWGIFQDFFRKMGPAWAAVVSVVLVAVGSLIFYQASFNFSTSRAPLQNDMQFVENIHLYRDFEVIANLELLEHWEEIVQLEEI
jgi:hypothetical protein